MRIAQAGCGFLGSLFALEAARRWGAVQAEMKEPLEFLLFDPDRVDERNVANQGFNLRDVGRMKAESLNTQVRLLGSAGERFNLPMTSKTWAPESKLTLPFPDLFVCAVDNIPARRDIWDLAVGMNVPLMVLGANQNGQGFVFWTDLAKGIDTDPFSPTQMTKLDPAEVAKIGQVRELPPCELTAMRGLGLNTALAGMRAFFRYAGLDVEAGEVARQEVGRHSLWTATIDGHREVK